MSQRARSLNAQGQEGARCLSTFQVNTWTAKPSNIPVDTDGGTYNKTPKKEWYGNHGSERRAPTALREVGKRVGKRLENDHATEPAVDQVVSVEGNAQEGDQGIVSPR